MIAIATLRALVQEPVTHFVLIGATLFALDAAIAPGEPVEPATTHSPFAVPRDPIVVDETLRATLVEHWNRTHPAPPDADELERLVERFVDEEVLYREGLARGLAEGDAQVRERVAGQMAYVLQSQVVPVEPSEDELRTWFEDHVEHYARPERVDFTQVYVEGLDDAAQAEARALLRLLEDGADPNGLGDKFAGGRRFRGRKLAELAERFGDAFIVGMETQPPGTWALRRSTVGVHLVRVDRWSAGESLAFEAARDQVHHDWMQDQQTRALTEARRALRDHWEIVVSP